MATILFVPATPTHWTMDPQALQTALDLHKHALASANSLWTFYIGVATVFVAVGFSDKIKLNGLGAFALTVAFVLFAIGNSLALARSHQLLARTALFIKEELPQSNERGRSPRSDSLLSSSTARSNMQSVKSMIAPLDETGPAPVQALHWIVTLSLLAVFGYGHTRSTDAKPRGNATLGRAWRPGRPRHNRNVLLLNGGTRWSRSGGLRRRERRKRSG
jgi:hypothetical protein